MQPRRIADHIKRRDWTAVCIEFVIVVAGVFVAVQVGSWWEGRADAQKERIYLTELKQDFSQIVAELDHDSKQYEGIAVSMATLLRESRREAPQLSPAELNRHASQILKMVGTPIVSDTYTNLTGSGDLALIHSQELKNALASFYARTTVLQLVANTHELQLVTIFQPFVMSNLDYVAVFPADRPISHRSDLDAALPAAFEPDRIRTVLPTSGFRNVVAIKWDITTDLHETLNWSLEQARAVDALLDQELARR